MDANKNVDDPNSKIMRILMETNLVDLPHYWYPAHSKPAMHQRGSTPIDMMLGSQLLSSALQYTWVLPFGECHLI